MLNNVLIGCFAVMLLALLFAIIRLRRGPGSVDRIIIFDLFSSLAIGLMGIASLWLKESTFLDVGILLSVVAFIGTIGFARYVEGRKLK